MSEDSTPLRNEIEDLKIKLYIQEKYSRKANVIIDGSSHEVDHEWDDGDDSESTRMDNIGALEDSMNQLVKPIATNGARSDGSQEILVCSNSTPKKM